MEHKNCPGCFVSERPLHAAVITVLCVTIFFCLVRACSMVNGPVESRESKMRYRVLQAFQSQELVPEAGFKNWFMGCCDPEPQTYLVFEYPVPKRPKNSLPADQWPTCYEIRYKYNVNPEGNVSFKAGRTIFYQAPVRLGAGPHGDGYGTDLTYQEFLKLLKEKGADMNPGATCDSHGRSEGGYPC